MAKHPRTKKTFEFVAIDKGDPSVGIMSFSETIKISISSDQNNDALISELDIEDELLVLLRNVIPDMEIRTPTDIEAENKAESDYYEQTQEEMDKR